MAINIDAIILGMKSYMPELNEDRIRKAYAFAEAAHHGQVRFSGDPYITHPLETTAILLPLQPDEDTIIASLLHDVPGDTAVSFKEIEKAFDAKVANLIGATEKLSLIKVQQNESQVDVWRKMFLAMAKDLRVIFIKLAERLHNMRTLEYVATEKQKRIAEETLLVYAPIASRLGIYSIKSELEDHCFRFLYPKEFIDLKNQLNEHGYVHEKFVKEAGAVLLDMLDGEGIPAEVTGRIKHLYSIYRKLRKKNTNSIQSVYDLFAMRVNLPDQYREGREFVGHCYTTLGAIHNRWMPIPGRFKDYIAVPKLNGYRSLHSTLMGILPSLKNQPVEIQIRTQSMHQEAEYGIASHWWYEDSRRASTRVSREEVEQFLGGRRLLNQLHALLDDFPDERVQFERFLFPHTTYDRNLEYRLRKFLEAHGFSSADVTNLLEFLGSSAHLDTRLKTLQHQIDWLYGLQSLQEGRDADSSGESDLGLFQDRIFVLTPEGDVKDLPLGSTPVDFAYSIHSDLGHRCFQAKVNGSIARLEQPLNSGDIVEIVTRKNSNPSRYWLSFVKTSNAKNKIKTWFRSIDRDKNIKAGRELLNKELKRLNQPLLGPNYKRLKDYGGKQLPFADREHIVELVGNGTMTANNVIRGLFSEEELMGQRMETVVSHAPMVKSVVSVDQMSDAILITGEANLPITLSGCCKPKFPQKIVGYVTRGKSIRVHRSTCRQIVSIESERFLNASWAAEQTESHYHVKVRVACQDRVGLMRDLLAVVSDMGMNISDVPLVSKEKGEVVRDLCVEILSYDKLAQLLSRLEKVESVLWVKKI